jgi:hypothetical protein
LQDFDFFRIKDTYSAYQEIQQWVANRARPEPPIPQIDDKTMAEIKGHGDRYSFRKPPRK